MIRSLSRLALLAQVLGVPLGAAPSWVYFGNAGMEPNSAIYASAFDPEDGTLGKAEPVFPVWNPVWLEADPQHHFLYGITGTPGPHMLPLARLQAFRIDPQSGKLSLPSDVSPGTPEPCHSRVSPDGGSLLLANYLDGSVHGYALYLSNRGEDTLVVYAIDPPTGALTLVQRLHDGISLPRALTIDPSGRWLIAANTGADNVSLYRIEPANGRLAPTGVARKVPKPLCVVFVPGR